MKNNFGIPSLLLRWAIAIPYVWFSCDRLGILGGPGQPHVGWGSWEKFMEFAQQVMSFLPNVYVPCEICRGPLGAGMEEIYQITAALKHLSFGKHVAVITDARRVDGSTCFRI